MRVVVDCNILVICISSHSPYHHIYQSLIKNKFDLVKSTDILLEDLPNVHHVRPHYKWQLIDADGDDNKYCDCAIAGQADYLVSEDKHFDVLKSIPFPLVVAISIDAFSSLIESSKSSQSI